MFSDTHPVKLGQGYFSRFGVSENDIIDSPNVAPGLAPGVRGQDVPRPAGPGARFCQKRQNRSSGIASLRDSRSSDLVWLIRRFGEACLFAIHRERMVRFLALNQSVYP